MIKKSPGDMKTAIERIDRATDEIRRNVSSLASTAAKQQGILEEHIKRTEINEKHLEHVQTRLRPLEEHVSMWAGAGKVLAILGTLATVSGVIYKLFF